MRITAFIMGGIVGAAAAMYFNKRTRPMLMSSFGQTGEAIGKMMSNGAGKMFNMRSGGGSDKSYSFSGASKSNAQGLSDIQNIVNKDDVLKSAVDGIMQESKH